MPVAPVLNWLLEESQPSVRYYALTELLGRAGDDPEVRSARAAIGRRGWASDILRTQKPQGFWERREPRNAREWLFFLWFPTFSSTIWKGLVLADLGLTSEDRRIRQLAERVFEYKLAYGSMINLYTEEMCSVGNTARMFTQFGYGEDPRVGRLYRWILEDQRENGGWHCGHGLPGTLDAWEPLSALAVVPKRKRSAAMDRAVERGAEFYLSRRLFREGVHYGPWFRCHYPRHYFYDLLVGLDMLTQLGFGGDRRLRAALKWLTDKRRSNGTWVIDRLHPDVSPPSAFHPPLGRKEPFFLEPPGKPSKMITLTALRVLKRVEDAG